MPSFSPARLFGLAAAVLAIVPFAARGEAQKGTAPGTLVLQGGTLIDGTGKDPVPNAVIVIEGDRIKAIGKPGEVTIPTVVVSRSMAPSGSRSVRRNLRVTDWPDGISMR